MSKFGLLVLGLIVWGVGVAIGYSFSKSDSPVTRASEFRFLNLAVTSNLNKHFIINFGPLKKKLTEVQKKYPQKTYIYFDYLNNASWAGLNERELFTAASTVKVPLAMSVYKAIEEKRLNVDDKYSLEDLDLDENFGELYKIGPDQELTVEELIKIMLEQSDNTAANALSNILGNIGITDPFSSVYAFMGWDIFPGIGQTQTYQQINLKTLSNMFISLYNAEYVNVENSNKILTFLSNTPFDNRIAAGVPEGVLVSHKIGVSVPDKTFSDCGIVYAPNRHYILCLGSNGGDEEKANRFMAEISKVVYEYVINN